MKITQAFTFEAAHRLPNVPESHRCHRMHGHSYRVELTLERARRSGHRLGRGLLRRRDTRSRRCWASLDHYCLNEVEGLENPTAEHIAAWIWDRTKGALPALSSVKVLRDADVLGRVRGRGLSGRPSAMTDERRPGPVLGRTGFHHLPRLGAGALRPRRDARLRLRPAPPDRARLPGTPARGASRPSNPDWAARLGEDHTHRPRRAGPDLRDGADPRHRDRLRGGRPAQHLRAGPQPRVPHLRGGARLSPVAAPHRRRHVRDRLLRLSRLPRRHHQGAAGGTQPRHGPPLRPAHAPDVDRQGRDLAAREGDSAGRRWSTSSSRTPIPATSASAATGTIGAMAAARARPAISGRRGMGRSWRGPDPSATHRGDGLHPELEAEHHVSIGMDAFSVRETPSVRHIVRDMNGLHLFRANVSVRTLIFPSTLNLKGGVVMTRFSSL